MIRAGVQMLRLQLGLGLGLGLGSGWRRRVGSDITTLDKLTLVGVLVMHEGAEVSSDITTLDKKAYEGLVWLYTMHPCQNHSPAS